MENSIPVLDKGYVALVDRMGTDLTVVNAARVSFDKRSKEMTGRDKGLIKYLADHDHTSPFRHAALSFEIYAPLMVARQWYKYVVGSAHDPLFAWNESSRRYVTEEPEFYMPQWRSSPTNKKQGSGEFIKDMSLVKEANRLMDSTIDTGYANYLWAKENGIAVEQARCYLPAYAMYVRWYWTASLQGVCHFLSQREKMDAQYEIREYAAAVRTHAEKVFPVAVAQLAPTPNVKSFTD